MPILDNLDDFTSLLQENELKEYPVDIDTFLYDRYFMGLKKVSDLQKLIISVMSQIYFPQTLEKLHGYEEAQRIWNQETVNELVLCLGKASGKDFTSRLAFAYAIHKLHCLKDPLDYYGKAYGTYIDMLNIAVNAEQAQNVFFEPLKNILGHSPYFKDKGFQVRTKRVDFDECPIRLFSGNSEAEAWEGLDLLLVVLDEIAAFKTSEQMRGATGDRLSAEAIYKMSKISVISRFPEVGKVACLSFPRSIDDFIMQRYDESEKEPKVFRLKAKTWEMNPTITREMLEPEYQRNPIDARARFEADPPRAANPFFKDPDRVLQCFQGQYKVIDEGTSKERRKLAEIPELNPIDTYGRLKPWFKCTDDYTRYIHVDLALNRDKVGLAMVHIPGVRTIQTSINTWDKLPVIKMDLVHWWQGHPGQEVDFGDIREFISILCRKFPVGLVTFDRWNSADTIATLQKRNIRAELHSVRTSDYDTLATAFYDGRFYGYFTDELVEQELLKLQLLPNGKVDHQKTSGKDISDALAGATYNACEQMEVMNEIEIEIIGSDDIDWQEHEMELAKMEDKERELGDRVRRNSVMYDANEINDFELQMI